jgi:hypothetical protein
MQYIGRNQRQPAAPPDHPSPSHDNAPAAVEGASTSAEHLRDLGRILVDNFGDTGAIDIFPDEHLERFVGVVLEHRRSRDERGD